MVNNKETEIRIDDLLAMVLKKSKGILCLILILGFLGGLYGAYSVVKAQPKVTQRDVEAAERVVATAKNYLEKAQNSLLFHENVKLPGALEKVERLKRQVLQSQDYMNDSIYYGMNPFHRGAARLRFSVEADNASGDALPSEDPRIGIVVAYTQMYPFDSKTIDHVQSIMGVETEPQYIEELISVTSDEDHYVVEICVLYDDLKIAEQVVDHLYETLVAQGKEALPQHKTAILSTYSGYEVDRNMSMIHTLNEKSLTNAEKALTDANNSLQSLQNDSKAEQAVAEARNALDAAQATLRDAEISSARNRPSLRSMAKRAVKYGLIAGLIGFLLGCGYALLKGIFGGTIQNQNEVKNRYPFPLIGVLPSSRKIWFDTAIRKLEGEPTGNFEANAQATVQSLLARIGDRSVCLVSSQSRSVAEKVAAYTDGRVQVCGNIINNPEAVKELADYAGIVFVEELGKSRLDLVDTEILRAKALNKEIVGMVLV